jgi:molybdopterin/thiamine biosynthesis adenylyltransferase
VKLDTQGIKTQTDADDFVRGADLVVDEMDFGLFRESIFLQRAARRDGIYYAFASAIGFGALIVIFDPKGMTLEEYDGLEPDADLDGATQPTVSLDKVCPVMPTYVSSIPKELADEIILGVRGLPTTSIGVGMASLLAAAEAANILLRRREVTCAPSYTCIDLLDRRFVVGTPS